MHSSKSEAAGAAKLAFTPAEMHHYLQEIFPQAGIGRAYTVEEIGRCGRECGCISTTST